MSGKPIPRSQTEDERRELENFRDRLQYENGLVRKLQGILSEIDDKENAGPPSQ